MDGDKRVAFALTAIFLRMNHYRLVVSAQDGEEFLVERIVVGGAELDEIEGWFESRFMKV